MWELGEDTGDDTHEKCGGLPKTGTLEALPLMWIYTHILQLL